MRAVVSLIEAKGVPAMVTRTLIAPIRMGPLTDAERRETIAASPLGTKYETPVNRESPRGPRQARRGAAAQAKMAEDMLAQAQSRPDDLTRAGSGRRVWRQRQPGAHPGQHPGIDGIGPRGCRSPRRSGEPAGVDLDRGQAARACSSGAW